MRGPVRLIRFRSGVQAQIPNVVVDLFDDAWMVRRRNCNPAMIGVAFREMVVRYSNLLLAAARLHERHRANRRRLFNVFAVLRSTSDEVNLHSRFLHALLDHTDPLSGQRENLEAFVRGVAQAEDLALADARVERESNHIDLLISNEREAIIVENKIWAGDQELQLQRYRDALVREGYEPTSIRLIYLTPYGHEPSEQSVGDIPIEQIQLVSYREDLRDWLIGCQQRAVEDPGLRESIAQYRRLIFKITNNGHETEHMNELKKLLLENDNLVLARQISQSLVDVEVELVKAFYEVVDRVLRETIKDLPKVYPAYRYCMEEGEISKCVRGQGRGRDSGLYYKFSESAWLFVGGPDRLAFGVSCGARDDAEMHEKLTKALANVGGLHHADSSNPWWQWLDQLPTWGNSGERLHICDPNEPTLEFLSSGEGSQAELVQSLAREIRELWRTINEQGFVSHS